MKDIGASLKSLSILIVEDVLFTRQVLSSIFEEEGFNDIRMAENGKEALEQIEERAPNLVILDVNMPIMDGYEFLKILRVNKSQSSIPVLVQTVNAEPEQIASIFEAGATDYIIKPVDHRELLARAYAHLERQIMVRQLEDYQMRVQEELSSAKKMQDILMPMDTNLCRLEERYNIDIESFCKTSSELGGDFWGAFPISDDKMGLYIVDFSGHGLSAALNTFRLHALMTTYQDLSDVPEAFMTEVNKALVPVLQVQDFATMFYAVMDMSNNKLFYITASHPDVILLRKNGSVETLPLGNGLAVGILKDLKYTVQEVDFHQGDALFLYSDALIETKTEHKDYLELDKLVDFFESNIKNASDDSYKHQQAFNRLVAMFQDDYMDTLDDDLTMNLYVRK